MTQDLIINSEYASLAPPLSIQENESLKRSIKENGQYFAIIINNCNVILDGHHRLRICRELGIEPIISVKNFASPDHEKLFVYECNLRRHLTPFQKIALELAAQDIKDRINKAEQNRLANLKHGSEVPKLELRELQGRTVERVAKNTKYGHGTVSKVKKLLDTAPENILRKLSTNKISIDKAFNDVEKEQRRKQTEEEAQTNYYNDKGPRFELFNDDFRNVQLTANSIDLIFTDPPYPESWLPNYADLAKLATNTLVPNGSLVTYCNHTQIREIIEYMRNEGLVYWWMFAVFLQGPFKTYWSREVDQQYKLLLWFVKGKRERTGHNIFDRIDSLRAKKDLFEWEQHTAEPEYVISQLTRQDQKVLDPMMGEGTTGIAALALTRKFVGIDKHPERFKDTRARIANFVSSGLDLKSD